MINKYEDIGYYDYKMIEANINKPEVTDWYVNAFKSFNINGVDVRKWYWSWGAFFGSIFYLLHRKAYALAGLLFIFLFQGCTSLFFYPDSYTYRTPDFYELKYKNIMFNSEDNVSLHAWHIFPSQESKGLIFLAHGNAQNISSHFDSWVWLIEEGYELFIFDYRAYGKSKGKSSLKGSIQDTKAALNYVESVYKKDYVVVGQSLGGTLLLNALDKRDNEHIKSVVIDSTFTGFTEIASSKMNDIWLTWPFQWIPSLSMTNDFDAKDKVFDLNKPLLFVHGVDDRTISANDSWQLFDLSNQPREFWLVKGAEHIQAFKNENIRTDFLDYLSKSDAFYNKNYSRMKIYE